jgi:hypothetical protein
MSTSEPSTKADQRNGAGDDRGQGKGDKAGDVPASMM